MRALIDDMKNERDHPGNPKLVVSNNVNAEGLVFAEQNAIETFVLIQKKSKTIQFLKKKHCMFLREKNIEVICLAGFMKILSENFIKSFSKPILNIHPSLLPSFRGLNTYQRALNAGCLIHGATVHQITSKVDQGPNTGTSYNRNSRKQYCKED